MRGWTVCHPYASGKGAKGCDKASISDDTAIRLGWCYETQLPSTTWFPSVRATPVSLARPTRASGPLPGVPNGTCSWIPVGFLAHTCFWFPVGALLVRQQSVHPMLLQPEVSEQRQLNSQAAAASNFWPWATSSSWAAAVTRPCAAEACSSWTAAPRITCAIAVTSSRAVAAPSFYVMPTYWATTRAGLSNSPQQVLCCGGPLSLSYSSLFDFEGFLLLCLVCFTLIMYLLFVYPHLFHVCHVDLPSLEYLKYLCVTFFLCQLSVVLHMPSFQLFFSVFSSSSLMFPSALKLCFAGAWTGKNDCCHIIVQSIIFYIYTSHLIVLH